jgi:predicted nucleic acid-binding protein
VTDPDDRTFAALAHAAGAILISNDDDLLRHRDRLGVTVLTPSAFWQCWQRQNPEQGPP